MDTEKRVAALNAKKNILISQYDARITHTEREIDKLYNRIHDLKHGLELELERIDEKIASINDRSSEIPPAQKNFE